jgi:hypothetical protein
MEKGKGPIPQNVLGRLSEDNDGLNGLESLLAVLPRMSAWLSPSQALYENLRWRVYLLLYGSYFW